MSLPPHLMKFAAASHVSLASQPNVNTNVNNHSSQSTSGSLKSSIKTKGKGNISSQQKSKRREKVVVGKSKPEGAKIENKLEKRIRKLKKSKVLKKKWKVLRKGGGEVWEDPTLEEWPENDFRIFCGDLGNEVSD